MPALNKVYDRLLIIRKSGMEPGLEGQVLGRRLFTPKRLIRELTVIEFGGKFEKYNFLVERHLALNPMDGEDQFIEDLNKRTPLGFASAMLLVSPRLFGYWGVKVNAGDCVPSKEDIPKAYEIISRYDGQSV